MMVKNSSFDLDFGYGRKGEQLVEALLTEGKTVEVKRDRKWWATNNIYIEVECWFNKSKSWEPSGLMVTTAEYWAFVLERCCDDTNRPSALCNQRVWQRDYLRDTTELE